MYGERPKGQGPKKALLVAKMASKKNDLIAKRKKSKIQDTDIHMVSSDEEMEVE